MTGELLTGGLAVAMAVCGVAMLQAAWRLSQRNYRLVSLGWLLLLAATLFWTTTTAADQGVAIGLVVLILVALAFLSVRMMRAPIRMTRPVRKRTAPDVRLGWRELLRRAWTGVLLIPIAGMAALLATTGVFVGLKALGVEHTANVTVGYFTFPLLWAALGGLIGYETGLVRKSLTVISVGAVPLALLVAMT